jgi:hypothetical protein
VVERDDTIASLKAKVAAKTQLDTTILRFRLNGVELEDTKMVKDTAIVEGSIINASLNSISIKVNIPSGETIDLDVDPANAVSSIKD